jgi:hypothetical protein
VPDHNDVLEVQLDEHFSEIVGVLVHIVALPRLVGAAKTPAVMATASVRIYRRAMSNFSSAIERPWPSHSAIDLDFVALGTMCSISVIGARVARAACAFLAGGPLGAPSDKPE